MNALTHAFTVRWSAVKSLKQQMAGWGWSRSLDEPDEEVGQEAAALMYQLHKMGFSAIKPASEQLIFWKNMKTPGGKWGGGGVFEFNCLQVHAVLNISIGTLSNKLPASSTSWVWGKRLAKRHWTLSHWEQEELLSTGVWRSCGPSGNIQVYSEQSSVMGVMVNCSLLSQKKGTNANHPLYFKLACVVTELLWNQ